MPERRTIVTPKNLHQIEGADYNPRKIDSEAASGLNASLKSFGDLSGIVVNLGRNGVLVAGHQRRDQLIALGASEIEWREDVETETGKEKVGVVRLPNGDEFRIRGVFWPEWKEKAANLAANNPHIQGGFTNGIVPLLAELKPQLESLMPELGNPFTSLKLADMMPAYAKKRDLLGDPNEIPDIPKEPTARMFDIWQLGEHRIMCSDVREFGSVDMLFEKTANAMVLATDPPYGVKYDNEKRPSNKGQLKRATNAVANDEITPSQLTHFLEDCFRPVVNVLHKNVGIYCWYPDVRTAEFRAALKEALGFVSDTTIVWNKSQLLPTFWHYNNKHELCMFGHMKGGKPRKLGNDAGEKNQTTVWEGTRVTKSERDEMKHSTPKPFELWQIPMEMHMRPGEVMFDPFAGSGPGLVACEKGGRVFRGFDIDPRNIDVMVMRWERLTGKKAELIHRVSE